MYKRQILSNEDKLDIYEDHLGSYLVQISQHGTSADDMHTISRLLHAIGDFERIGDHVLNLQESAKELRDKQDVYKRQYRCRAYSGPPRRHPGSA